jgi:hypothetical protein
MPLVDRCQSAHERRPHSVMRVSGGVAMPTFIMLTRLNADAVRSPRGLRAARTPSDGIRAEGMPRDRVARQLRCSDLTTISISLSPTTWRQQRECRPSFAPSATPIPRLGPRRIGTDSKKLFVPCRVRLDRPRTGSEHSGQHAPRVPSAADLALPRVGIELCRRGGAEDCPTHRNDRPTLASRSPDRPSETGLVN